MNNNRKKQRILFLISALIIYTQGWAFEGVVYPVASDDNDAERWAARDGDDVWEASTYVAFKAACEDQENMSNSRNSLHERPICISRAVLDWLNREESKLQNDYKVLESDIKKKYNTIVRKIYIQAGAGDEIAARYSHSIEDITSCIRVKSQLNNASVEFEEARNFLKRREESVPSNQSHECVYVPGLLIRQKLNLIKMGSNLMQIMQELSHMLHGAALHVKETFVSEHIDLFFGNSAICKDYQLGGIRPQSFQKEDPEIIRLCRSLREEDIKMDEAEFEMLIEKM